MNATGYNELGSRHVVVSVCKVERHRYRYRNGLMVNTGKRLDVDAVPHCTFFSLSLLFSCSCVVMCMDTI